MGRITRRTRAWRLEVRADEVRVQTRPEVVAVEEPLEIRIDGRSVAVTMRTPGDDFDLVLGWLHAEGLIAAAGDVRTLMHCQDLDERGRPTFNVVDVATPPGAPLDVTPRAVVTSSACGMCGAASIEATRRRSRYDLGDDEVRLDPRLLVDLPRRLRAHQSGFDRTGGTHAAGLFDSAGELLCVREDVGRHNAVDKVVGWALRAERLPLAATVLQVSGRASFELVQKARLAGIPVLAAVGAPSSLAVELADQVGLTLVGFSRGHSLVAYTHERRIS